MDIIRRDLKDMDTTSAEAKELATDRAEWRQRVAAQCIHLLLLLAVVVVVVVVVEQNGVNV